MLGSCAYTFALGGFAAWAPKFLFKVHTMKLASAKSKGFRLDYVAKFDKGYLVLQGDHGKVSFQNVKLREIKPAQK